jgi:hypothetical protein
VYIYRETGLSDVMILKDTPCKQYRPGVGLEKVTYTLPVFVGDMAILQGELDLLLELGRDLVVAINHVRVASSGLNQVLNLLGRNTSPAKVSGADGYRRRSLPVPVLPALMILDGDLDGIAELAFGDLDGSVLALLVLTSCTIVGAHLWSIVSRSTRGQSPEYDAN